jgi:hypothetical protein
MAQTVHCINSVELPIWVFGSYLGKTLVEKSILLEFLLGLLLFSQKLGPRTVSLPLGYTDPSFLVPVPVLILKLSLDKILLEL